MAGRYSLRLKADPSTVAIPVIIASAVRRPARGLALGADEYLRKPISRDELVDALRHRSAGLGVVRDPAQNPRGGGQS